ncbi:MAG: hypothetical protein ABH837_03565 [bacterium]
MDKKYKIWFTILSILVIGLLVIIGYGSYSYYKNKKDWENQIQDLKNDLEKYEQSSNSNDNSDTDSQDCTTTLTEDDKRATADWNEFTNNDQGFSFKTPHNWSSTGGESNIIGFEAIIESDLIGFQFRSAEMTEIGIDPSYTLFDSIDTKVACEDATKNYYRSDEYHMIHSVFNKDGTPHLIMLTYPADMGASIASDLGDQYDLILKTIEFE